MVKTHTEGKGNIKMHVRNKSCEALNWLGKESNSRHQC